MIIGYNRIHLRYTPLTKETLLFYAMSTKVPPWNAKGTFDIEASAKITLHRPTKHTHTTNLANSWQFSNEKVDFQNCHIKSNIKLNSPRTITQ